MAELRVPQVDFSWISELPQKYRQATKEMTLADIGRGIAEGTIDYKQAGAKLAGLGDLNTGLSLIRLGEQQKAGSDFMSAIASMYGGQSPTQTAQRPAAPQASTSNKIYDANEPSPLDPPSGADRDMAIRTVYGEDPGQSALAVANVIRNRAVAGNYGGDNVPSVVLAKGQFEPWADPAARARMASLQPGSPEYERIGKIVDSAYTGANDPTNGATHFYAPKAQAALGRSAPAWAAGPGQEIGPHRFYGAPGGGQPADNAVLPQGATPAGPASAQPSQGGLDVSPRILQLLSAVANPMLPDGQKEVAKTLLSRELDNSKLPDPVKQYLFAKGQGFAGTFVDYQLAIRKAGATNVTVDQKGETKFEEEFGKKQADRYTKYMDAADAARRKMVDINTMREISTRLGTQGAVAGIKEAIGPYADALGVNIDGLSDIQAYTQVIQRLAPQQRAPGSGSTSDIEFKGFLKSLPGLSQNPAAREVGLNTMEALARDDIARGEIASRLATGEIKRAEAEKQLRDLPDPMKGFVEWRKANPQMYGQALKGEAVKQSAPNRQQADQPPLPGAQRAPDGKYYIQRDGQWFRVEQ